MPSFDDKQKGEINVALLNGENMFLMGIGALLEKSVL